jgi:hypothetical protein
MTLSKGSFNEKACVCVLNDVDIVTIEIRRIESTNNIACRLGMNRHTTQCTTYIDSATEERWSDMRQL